MKTTLTIVTMALNLVCCLATFGQEQKTPATDDAKANQSDAGNTAKPKSTLPSQEQLEAKFKAMLTKATMSGRWSPIENAQLGPEKKEDKYSIVSADKIRGDQWLIKARMKYGENEFVIPVPVQVQWSADTPVLIVNSFTVDGNRSYSARVLFFDNTYAGTWTSNSGFGGLLYGTITRESDSSPKSGESKPTEKK